MVHIMINVITLNAAMFGKEFHDAAEKKLLSFGSKLHEYDNGERGCIIFAGTETVLGHQLC